MGPYIGWVERREAQQVERSDLIIKKEVATLSMAQRTNFFLNSL